ncbi:MAG: class I SAM-dependent methyltransferase [Actinomycetota bacterium]|nr:class I SAM-dependent methyltransferase [Actinomycetota bacterium]
MERPSLGQVLEEGRRLGFLGPGPVEGHVEHARGFIQAVGHERPRRVVDLGSGAGIPGLVLAQAWPDAELTLLDSNERRTAFLDRVVRLLGWSSRVSVVRARAEDVGRDPLRRGGADVVTARGFGPPAVTAECAAPLLRVGGRLVVSEPPEDDEKRWPAEPLAELGLRPSGRLEQAFARFQVLRQERPCPPAFPRRSGVPAKRPLF